MKPGACSLQLIRFGVVGLGSNLVLYAFYLGLTAIDVGPKLAMSLLWVVGVLQTFVLNRKWTFSDHGRLSVAFVRYISLYAIGYLINLGVMIVMVDRLGYSHQWVQGIMVLFIAVLLFVMQKAWAFRAEGSAGT
jgi:putative flippase GtrA